MYFFKHNCFEIKNAMLFVIQNSALIGTVIKLKTTIKAFLLVLTQPIFTVDSQVLKLYVFVMHGG